MFHQCLAKLEGMRMFLVLFLAIIAIAPIGAAVFALMLVIAFLLDIWQPVSDFCEWFSQNISTILFRVACFCVWMCLVFFLGVLRQCALLLDIGVKWN
jgi:hypothetical protein